MNYTKIIPSEFDPSEYTDSFIRECCIAWRNRQLGATDWTQLADVSLTNKSAWAAYRQELRDLPQQNPDPKKWIFPVPPS